MSCVPKLSQGKAAGVLVWHRLALHAAALSHSQPHRLAGCSRCHKRQQTGRLETHLWQGKPLLSFQSQVPRSATTAAAFRRAPALALEIAHSPTGSLLPTGADAAQQQQG